MGRFRNQDGSMLLRATFYRLRIQDHHICFLGSKGFIVIKVNISIWTQKKKILQIKITRWNRIIFGKSQEKIYSQQKNRLPVKFAVKKIFRFTKYNLLNDTKSNKEKTNKTVKGDILKFVFFNQETRLLRQAQCFLKFLQFEPKMFLKCFS